MPDGYQSQWEYIQDTADFCRLIAEASEDKKAVLKKRELIQAREKNSTFTPAPITLYSALGLGKMQAFCVSMIMCCQLNSDLDSLIRQRYGTPITASLAIYLWGKLWPVDESELAALLSCELPPFGLILEHTGLTGGMRLRNPVLRFLMTGVVVPEPPCRMMSPINALHLHQSTFETLCRFSRQIAQGKEFGYIFLTGPDGAGKRTIIGRVAQSMGIPAITLSCGSLPAGVEASVLAGRMSLDIALSGALVCVKDYHDCHKEALDNLFSQIPIYNYNYIIFVLGGEESHAPWLAGRPPFKSAIGLLSHDEKDIVNKTFAGAAVTEDLPMYFHLTAGQLIQIWQELHSCQAEGVSSEKKDFLRAVRNVSSGISKVDVLEYAITLDEVIVAPETRRKLNLLCNFIKRRNQVRARSESPDHYGKGVTGLFSGASGTGKTMSAIAIAWELGLELLRIDLSQVLDKYIGETEKKLSQVFTEASNRNCILFFDEADALFSTRTKSESSHDRYANIETSFLLQCIEEYDGITLLATNLFQNFDKAFLRRITVMIPFYMPDAGMRLKLWETYLPSGADAAACGGVDFNLLAQNLELSPAAIKSTVFTAAILAAKDNGETASISMSHILEALENELVKWGSSSMLSDFKSMLE